MSVEPKHLTISIVAVNRRYSWTKSLGNKLQFSTYRMQNLTYRWSPWRPPLRFMADRLESASRIKKSYLLCAYLERVSYASRHTAIADL